MVCVCVLPVHMDVVKMCYMYGPCCLYMMYCHPHEVCVSVRLKKSQLERTQFGVRREFAYTAWFQYCNCNVTLGGLYLYNVYVVCSICPV